MPFVSWLFSGRFYVGIAPVSNAFLLPSITRSIVSHFSLSEFAIQTSLIQHQKITKFEGHTRSILINKLPYFAKNNSSILTINDKLYFKMTFTQVDFVFLNPLL